MYPIATPPEEDRSTAIGDLHIKFGNDRSSGSRDMLADRQIHTDKHTDTQTDELIAILRSPTGRSNNVFDTKMKHFVKYI